MVFYHLSIMVFFLSCGVTYKVSNQHAEYEHFVYFPCGKVGLELVGRGNSKFTLIQNFELDSPVKSFPGAVEILINDQPIQTELRNVSVERQHDKGISKTEIKFETPSRVKDGDMIAISSQNYVHCRDFVAGIDTIYYKFANRLVIHGVNSF